jgi:DegT/DnrJ/EryC1/StrS aminotransferase family
VIRVPFNRPFATREEIDYIRAAIAAPKFSGDLAGFGVLAVFHYLPLYLSPMGLRFGGRQGDCPVTEDLADRLLRLPFFTGMSSSEQSQVIDALRGSHCQAGCPGDGRL